MAVVTLAEAKAHLRVDWPEDDAYITGLTEAVSATLAEQGVAIAAPSASPDVKHAALLLIGHFYINREAVGSDKLKKVPLALEMLIAPHRELFP